MKAPLAALLALCALLGACNRNPSTSASDTATGTSTTPPAK